MQAFVEGDDTPRIEVDCSNGEVWTFTLDNRKGSGAVQVGLGCDYNPLSLIQSMWFGFEDGQFHGLTPNARVAFDEEIDPDAWAAQLMKDLGDEFA